MSALAGAPGNRRGQVLAAASASVGSSPIWDSRATSRGMEPVTSVPASTGGRPRDRVRAAGAERRGQDETREMTFLSMAPARCALRQAVAERGDDLAFPAGSGRPGPRLAAGRERWG